MIVEIPPNNLFSYFKDKENDIVPVFIRFIPEVLLLAFSVSTIPYRYR
jgi:hypothetical protein